MAHVHDPNEPFPRQEVAAAVAGAQEEALRRRERRDATITWVLAAGLAALALGLPDPRLVGDMSFVRASAGAGGSVTIVPVVVRGLAWLTSVPHERVAFGLAAVSWALVLPALRALLVTVGFPRREALLLAVVGVVSPTAFAGGTLPLEHAHGMLGATLLAGTLFRTQQVLRWGYQWRVTLVLFLAILLRFENVLLVPAAAVALADQGRSRGLPWALPPICLGLVLVVSLSILVDGRWADVGRDLLAGADPSLRHVLGWAVRLAIGLGGLAVGVFALLLGRRDPEEAPPPWWVVPWALAALVPVVGGDPAVGPTAGYLVPLGVLGLADLRVRTRHPERLVRTGALLLGVQLGLAIGLRLQAPDPERAWRDTAEAVLEPGDTLWTDDPAHRYLVTYRWAEAGLGLRAGGATDPPEAGGRAILDGVGPPPREGMLRLVPGRGLEPAARTADDG